MNQLGIPYVKGSLTSQAAAMSQSRAHGMDEMRVLQHIGKIGAFGATDDEVEFALDMLHQTASARRRTLVMREQLVDSGITRKTRSGRPATVWVIPQFGPLALGLPAPARRGPPTKEQLKAFVKEVDGALDLNVKAHAEVMAWLKKRAGIRVR